MSSTSTSLKVKNPYTITVQEMVESLGVLFSSTAKISDQKIKGGRFVTYKDKNYLISFYYHPNKSHKTENNGKIVVSSFGETGTFAISKSLLKETKATKSKYKV